MLLLLGSIVAAIVCVWLVVLVFLAVKLVQREVRRLPPPESSQVASRRRVLRDLVLGSAAIGAIFVLGGLVGQRGVIIGTGMFFLSLAWLCAVFLMWVINIPIPMRDGSRISKADNGWLYRFWTLIFLLFGCGGMLLAFSVIRRAA